MFEVVPRRRVFIQRVHFQRCDDGIDEFARHHEVGEFMVANSVGARLSSAGGEVPGILSRANCSDEGVTHGTGIDHGADR